MTIDKVQTVVDEVVTIKTVSYGKQTSSKERSSKLMTNLSLFDFVTYFTANILPTLCFEIKFLCTIPRRPRNRLKLLAQRTTFTETNLTQ